MAIQSNKTNVLFKKHEAAKAKVPLQVGNYQFKLSAPTADQFEDSQTGELGNGYIEVTAQEVSGGYMTTTPKFYYKDSNFNQEDEQLERVSAMLGAYAANRGVEDWSLIDLDGAVVTAYHYTSKTGKHYLDVESIDEAPKIDSRISTPTPFDVNGLFDDGVEING